MEKIIELNKLSCFLKKKQFNLQIERQGNNSNLIGSFFIFLSECNSLEDGISKS